MALTRSTNPYHCDLRLLCFGVDPSSGGLGHLAVLLTVCHWRSRLVCFARHPRWGYATMGFFAILLASFAVRFAHLG